jgi:hypothetical protein
MTGPSIVSMHTSLTTQIPQSYAQAYIPHNHQLRFLKMKIILAKVIPGKYNVASKTQSFNHP